MSDRVMTFAGALSGSQARGLLAFAGVPWNKVPASLNGAALREVAEARPLPSGGPIRVGERLVFQVFERTPSSLVWFVVVQRPDVVNQPIVRIPAGVAVRLGIVTQAAVDRLVAQTTPEKLKADIERMARQAGLDTARHHDERMARLKAWVETVAWAPVLGLTLGAVEEVWPGVIATIAEDALRGLCQAPVTAVPAYLIGACDGLPSVQSPLWVKVAIVAGVAVAVVAGVYVLKSLVPR